MTSETAVRARPSSRPRDLGVDLARGVAVVSMFVAHTAPGAGPGGVLLLSEFLTFPLFALLVGAGAELGARTLGVVPHGLASSVRAVALLALGWALAQAGAHVVIVLAPLGVLTLLCWLVSRLPTPAVVAVGLASGLLAPWTIEVTRDRWLELVVAGETGALWWLDLLVSTSYPQAVLLLCGSVGIVLTRLLLPRDGGAASPRLLAGLVTGALLVGGVLSAARVVGRIELVAYETSWLEELFVVALATGTYAACLALARWSGVRTLTPLAWVGAMTLTVYSLHVGWLAWWARGLFPGTPDDAWVNVVGMSVGALVVAGAWRAARLPAPWTRGPLEGVVGLGVRLVGRGSGAEEPRTPRGGDREPGGANGIDVSVARTEVRSPVERG